MKVDMVLRIKDVPGALLNALEPVSVHGGNIISVTHSRAEKNRVLVYLSFSVGDEATLELIRKRLEEARVSVSKVDIEGKTYYLKRSMSFIFVGHVIDRDLQDTVDRINALGLVTVLDVVMPSPEKRSTVMLHVEVEERCERELIDLLESISREKDFLMIRSI